MFLNKGGIILIISMFLATYGYSKVVGEVLLNPIANAGVDASTCFPTYQLTASVSNATVTSWQTLGDGTFSNSSITDPIYTIGFNDISNGIVNLVFSASDGLVTVTDTMVLTVFTYTASAGPDDTICAGDSYMLNSSTNNGTTFIWLAMGGDGTFSNSTILNPTYIPGSNDINTGFVTLLFVCSNAFCPAVQDFITLTIHPLPPVLAPISHN